MKRLTIVFIGHYFKSLNHFTRTSKLPDVWQPILTKNLPSFFYAILGANIHIGYDLTNAILKINDLKLKEDDFNKADTIIYNARDLILKAFLETSTNSRILYFSHILYDKLTVLLIISWRHNAWGNYEKIITQKMNSKFLHNSNLSTSNKIILFGKILNFFGISKLFKIKLKCCYFIT